jgi:hypothetical protein
MKWFQQNRSLGTLLIVFGICALLATMLLFWARSKWAAARREFDAAAAERSRLQRLDPFPSAPNYERLKVHLGNYIAALDKFKEELKKEVAPAPPLAPNEFQSRLRQAVIATLNSARANNVKLPDKFQLGFDEFTTALPKTAVTPLLGQELSQMQMLINIVLDAKVDSVTSLHRAALPEEREASPTPSLNPVPVPGRKGSPARGQKPTEPSTTNLVERDVVDLTFKAAPAAARKVLNEIASSNEQFFIIRTLYVHNETDKGPPRGKTPETNASAPQTADANQPGSAGPLNFIVGNEHVEVSARIEMLRFMF